MLVSQLVRGAALRNASHAIVLKTGANVVLNAVTRKTIHVSFNAFHQEHGLTSLDTRTMSTTASRPSAAGIMTAASTTESVTKTRGNIIVQSQFGKKSDKPKSSSSSSSSPSPTDNIKYAGEAKRVRDLVEVILTELSLSDFDVAVRLVTEPTMRKLNNRFRGVDAPTDVLSFPYQEV